MVVLFDTLLGFDYDSKKFKDSQPERRVNRRSPRLDDLPVVVELYGVRLFIDASDTGLKLPLKAENLKGLDILLPHARHAS